MEEGPGKPGPVEEGPGVHKALVGQVVDGVDGGGVEGEEGRRPVVGVDQGVIPGHLLGRQGEAQVALQVVGVAVDPFPAEALHLEEKKPHPPFHPLP